MTIDEKAKTLYDRHVKIIIEWGGTEHYTDFSEMSQEGMIKLLLLIKRINKKEDFNRILTDIIQKEHDKQH